jgi:DHA3 family macrolide efflux protein-like MFS transporter
VNGPAARPSLGPPLGPGHAYPVEEPTALGVLRNRPFLGLWLSQLSTQVGGNMVLYGLTVHISGLSPTGNYAAVSVLFLCFLLPSALVSPIAGVYVDRLDQRLILVVTNALRAAAFVGLLLAGDNLPAIYALSIFVSTASTFFAPTEAAMIPRVVPRTQLVAANGLFIFTLNASFGLGFAVAGPLVRVVAGYEGLLLVVAVLYAAAAAFCLLLPRSDHAPLLAPVQAVAEAESAVASMLAELRAGVAYIAANHRIFWAIAYLALSSSLIGVLGVLGPGFARSSLGLTEESFVVIVVPLFAGLITAVLLLNQYGRYLPRRRLIEGALLSLAVLLAVLSVAGPLSRFLGARAQVGGIVDFGPLVSLLSIVVFIAFLAGMAYAAIAIPAQTQLQEELPEDVRGRVFGVLNTLISLAALVPIVIVGPLADRFGVETIMVAAGVVTAAVGVGSILRARPPEVVSAAPRGVHAPVDPVTGAGVSLLRPKDLAGLRGERDDAEDVAERGGDRRPMGE